MKKLIFCLIAIAAIATLLLPSGQAFAKSKWVQVPIGDDEKEFLENWAVEQPVPDCYNYTVDNGTLTVTADATCAAGDRFVARVDDGGLAKEIRADVTVIESYGCWRTRLLADPLYVLAVDGMPIRPDMPDGDTRDGSAFQQLSVLNEWCFPSMISRFIAYPAASPWLTLFEGRFLNQWTEPGIPNIVPIIGNTFTLTLAFSIPGSLSLPGTINAAIEDDMGQSLGEIVYEVPGLGVLGGNFLGLSCYTGNIGDRGEARFSNVWVR